MNRVVKEDLPVFQQQIFETTNADIPLENKTLQEITKERGQRLTKSKIDDLVAPGSYKFNTNEDSLSGSNTRHLFKNLYGETLLTFLFFSKKNIDNIQDILKYVVHRETGYIIDNQSVNELLIVMRALFLEYSLHPKLITEEMSPKERNELLQKYTAEVARLNMIIVNQVVPKIISQIQQYVDYLRDASEQPYYMDKPKNDSVKGQKQYRSITQVLAGGQF